LARYVGGGVSVRFIVVGALARYVGIRTGAYGADFGAATHVDFFSNSWQHAGLDLGTWVLVCLMWSPRTIMCMFTYAYIIWSMVHGMDVYMYMHVSCGWFWLFPQHNYPFILYTC